MYKLRRLGWYSRIHPSCRRQCGPHSSKIRATLNYSKIRLLLGLCRSLSLVQFSGKACGLILVAFREKVYTLSGIHNLPYRCAMADRSRFFTVDKVFLQPFNSKKMFVGPGAFTTLGADGHGLFKTVWKPVTQQLLVSVFLEDNFTRSGCGSPSLYLGSAVGLSQVATFARGFCP